MDRVHLEGVRKIVSHADCPDGFASALLLRDALPHASIVFVEHSTPEFDGLAAEPGMLFCDIAPPAHRVNEFIEAGTIVLDHHRAKRDLVASFGDRGVFADEKTEPGVSGALLAYREVWLPLHDGQDDADLLRFATLAGVRDTWQTESPDWDEACAHSSALVFYGFDALTAPKLDDAHMVVGRRLVQQRAEAAKLAAAGKWFRMREDVIIYNDRDRLLSDVAHVIFERQAKVEIVCGFFYKVTSDGELLLVFAMRSRKNGRDVSTIAKRNGGGGHTSAAGFSQAVVPSSPNPVEAFRIAIDD
jgi:hypothetical protein